MNRIGRGRGRGARMLELNELAGVVGRGSAPGKIMIGRGTLVLNEASQQPLPPSPGSVQEQLTLEAQLLELVRTRKGNFINISLKYFEQSEDVKYFMDKVVDYVLKSSFLVEKFTMSFRLLSLLKPYGPKIKETMFLKLQSTFQEIQIFMQDPESLSKIESETAKNFSDLLGQMYFRFRVKLGDASERYGFLAAPCLQCMNYLITVAGHQELVILNKLIIFNYSSMREKNSEEMNSFDLKIREALKNVGETEDTIRALLMCALDLVNNRGKLLPPHLSQFYAEWLGRHWTEAVPPSRTQLLADIPPDIVASEIHRFDLSLEDYTNHRFTSL